MDDSVETKTLPASESLICHMKSPTNHWFDLKKVNYFKNAPSNCPWKRIVSVLFQPFLRNNEFLQQVSHALYHILPVEHRLWAMQLKWEHWDGLVVTGISGKGRH